MKTENKVININIKISGSRFPRALVSQEFHKRNSQKSDKEKCRVMLYNEFLTSKHWSTEHKWADIAFSTNRIARTDPKYKFPSRAWPLLHSLLVGTLVSCGHN